jgi:hypothetical protein
MDLKMGKVALFWRLKALKSAYFRVCADEFGRLSRPRRMAGREAVWASFSNKTEVDIYILECVTWFYEY